LLKETTGAFDGVRTHDLHMSQDYNIIIYKLGVAIKFDVNSIIVIIMLMNND